MRLCTQARILLLGEGDVGKTALLQSLIQSDAERITHVLPSLFSCSSLYLPCFRSNRVDRKQTEDMEIEKQVYTPPHGLKTKIQASIWDFGGQDIFHATHVFFLSSGALTMVLYNVVKGPKQSRLGQWLEMVEHTSPDARILIVGTRLDEFRQEKMHQRHEECNMEIDEIKKTFKKLTFCGHIQISNASGRGLPELEDLIYEQLNELPNVGKYVPNSYVSLKECFENNLITRGHYVDIEKIYEYCKSKLQMNESESESALQFCVDLGVAVWRHQEENVNKTVFVDPEFLIASFRKVFNIGNSKQMNGVFNHRDLKKTFTYDFDKLITLFRSLGLSYSLSESLEIFPILVQSRENVPEKKWKIDPIKTKEIVSYIYKFQSEVPVFEISKLIVGILKFVDEKKIERKSPLVFLGRTNIIFPVTLSESNEIEKGVQYQLRVELMSELDETTTDEAGTSRSHQESSQLTNEASKSARSEHDIRLPVCRNIIIHVQAQQSNCDAFRALMAVKQRLIETQLLMKANEEGIVCPHCMNENHDAKIAGLISSDDVSEEGEIVECSKGHEIQTSSLKLLMLGAAAQTDDFSGFRTQKETITKAALENKRIKIFLSSTFQDMKSWRESLTRYAQPMIEMEARGLGLSVDFIDLRWGVSEEESKNGETIIKCLQAVKESDYFVCFLGNRYGWIPERNIQSEWSPETEEKFSWVKKHEKASATELEIQAACLDSDAQYAYRTFFYEKEENNSGSNSQPDAEDQKKQADLKKRILTAFYKDGSQIPTFKDVFELIKTATRQITSALKKDSIEINKDQHSTPHKKEKQHEKGAFVQIHEFLNRNYKSLSPKQEYLIRKLVDKGNLNEQRLLDVIIYEIDQYRDFEKLDMFLENLLEQENQELLMCKIIEFWEFHYGRKCVSYLLSAWSIPSTELGLSWTGIKKLFSKERNPDHVETKSRAFFALLVRVKVLRRVSPLKGLGYDRFCIDYASLNREINRKYLENPPENLIKYEECLNILKSELEEEINEPIQGVISEEILKIVSTIYAIRSNSIANKEPCSELFDLVSNRAFLTTLAKEYVLRKQMESLAQKLGFSDSNDMWKKLIQKADMVAVLLSKELSRFPQLLDDLEHSLRCRLEEKEKDDHGKPDEMFEIYDSLLVVVRSKMDRCEVEIREVQEKQIYYYSAIHGVVLGD